MAYAEDIIIKIDGPMLRKQRRAILQLLNTPLTESQEEALEGLTNLLDEIADCAHDIYGKDCMFSESELNQKAEEIHYEQRTQQYNH
jgi:hypothetical protein